MAEQRLELDPSKDPAAALLLECALVITAFRNSNAKLGYVFREPLGVSAILLDIDTLVNTDTSTTEKTAVIKRKRPKEPAIEITPALQHVHRPAWLETDAGKLYIENAIAGLNK